MSVVLPSTVLDVPALNARGGLPRIVDAAALLADPPQTPGELVEGVLHQGSKMILGGGSKSFKTWVLVDLAISTALGKEWLGFATNPTRVLYVNFELHEAFMAKRIQQIQEAKGVALPKGRLDVSNLRGHAEALPQLRDQIIASSNDGGYGLIVLDPIYKLLGDIEENSNTQVTKLLNEIEKIAVQTGAAVVFGHHFSKGGQAGKASIDRVSGAGAWARDPDSIVTLTPHQEDDCFSVEMALRNHRPQAGFVVRHEHPLMVRDDSLDARSIKRPGRQPVFSVDQIVGLIPAEGITRTDLKRLAMDNSNGPGMSDGSFNAYLNKAVEKGDVVKMNRRYMRRPSS